MDTQGFMTVALGDKYEPFIATYLASTLISFPEATCEIRVRTPPKYLACNAKLLDRFKAMFGDRFLITGVGFAWERRELVPNTVRFMIEPQLARPDMLYIGDVDIIVSDRSLFTFHAEAMHRLQLPYSNIIRKNKKQRLTGLHMVRTEPYFAKITQAVRDDYMAKFPRTNDEHILYLMCRKHIGLPAVPVGRPVFGVHVSPQRKPVSTKKLHWGIEAYRQQHQALVQSAQWQELFPTFPASIRHKIDVIARVLNSKKD